MRSPFAVLRALFIPAGSLPGAPQLIIGGADIVPADLQAFYTALGQPVIAAMIYRTSATFYAYYAQLGGGGGHVVGASNAGLVAEMYGLGTFASVARMLFGISSAAYIQIGTNGGPAGSELTIVPATAKLTVDVDVITGRNASTRGASANGTTVAAAYADMPGTPGVSITKLYPAINTSLLVTISQTLFMSVGVAEAVIGIRINGVDTDVSQFFFSNTGIRHQLSGQAKIGGLAAGAYTCTMRWKRNSGAGTINVSTLDSFSCTVQEVAN